VYKPGGTPKEDSVIHELPFFKRLESLQDHLFTSLQVIVCIELV